MPTQQMQHLHPRSMWLFALRYFAMLIVIQLFAASPIVAFIDMALKQGNGAAVVTAIPWIAAAFAVNLLVFACIAIALGRLSYHFYRYELTDAAFRKERGIIWKRYTTIPYDRIQNVDIHRGPVARILGLSELRIETAGSGEAIAEGRLPGLTHDVAEELRTTIIARAGRREQQRSP